MTECKHVETLRTPLTQVILKVEVRKTICTMYEILNNFNAFPSLLNSITKLSNNNHIHREGSERQRCYPPVGLQTSKWHALCIILLNCFYSLKCPTFLVLCKSPSFIVHCECKRIDPVSSKKAANPWHD